MAADAPLYKTAFLMTISAIGGAQTCNIHTPVYSPVHMIDIYTWD